MIADFSKREKECFDFLNQIPKRKRYVVIGGYAVTSFGFPRFSVDLDITIPENELTFFKKLLSEYDFILKTTKEDLAYSGRFERYEKGLVSIDLLINGVQSRQTNYLYPFEYIYKNSEIRETNGWDPINKSKARIVKKEMLIALKIHSMRMADKRDIIMLCYEKPDAQKISRHLEKSPKDILKKHVIELQTVFSDNKFKDSLKGVYSVNDKIYTKIIENCHLILNEIMDKLE
jgi:hypothetical protein